MNSSWTVKKDKNQISCFEIMDGDQKIVCGGCEGDGGVLRGQDARLIAAAPDMLDALKDVVESFNSGMFTRSALERAERVIAQAEGEA